MRNKIENIKQKIAQPYVGEAVWKTTNKLTKYYADTRKLDLVNLTKKLDYIKYDKPWPKDTSLDDAFNLAVHEAIQIVESELRK